MNNWDCQVKTYFLPLQKKMPSFHILKVIAVERLNSDSVVVSLEIPNALKRNYLFIPGQYVTLETEIEGAAIRRSYSLCSSPLEDTLRVGIKEMPNGTFSTYINRNLNVGQKLNVS